MLNYHTAFAKNTGIRHRELALRQNTRYAVLPIHTAAERALFRFMITQLGSSRKENGTSTTAPNWHVMATQWSAHCDGRTIFYKLPEHLRAHWKGWMDIVNEKSSITISQAMYDEMKSALAPSMVNVNSIPAIQPTATSKQVLAPGPSSSSPHGEVDEWHVRQLLDRQSLVQTAINLDFAAVEHPNHYRVHYPTGKGKRRTFEEGPGAQPTLSSVSSSSTAATSNSAPRIVKQHRQRKCPRCHRAECLGRFNSRPCGIDPVSPRMADLLFDAHLLLATELTRPIDTPHIISERNINPSSMPDDTAAKKKPRGRPKGSKNGPNAGLVGRPRKDGQPPMKKLKSGGVESVSNSRGTSRASAVESSACLGALRNSVHSSGTGTGDTASNNGDTPTDKSCALTTTSSIAETGQPLANSDHPQAVDSPDPDSDTMISASEVTGLQCTLQDVDDTETAATAQPASHPATFISDSTNGLPSPVCGGMWPHGLDDEDDDDEVPFQFTGDENEVEEHEFDGVPDDDEASATELSQDKQTEHPRVAPTGSLNAFSFISKDHPQPFQERSAMPTWLKERYDDVREQLRAEMKANPSRRPTCYDQGSFYFGPHSAFFPCSQRYQITPEDVDPTTFFVWLPHCLQRERIPCPECTAADRKKNGETIHLRALGWPKLPRRVVDIDKCIYIIGYRYNCVDERCKRTYQSWSPALLSALSRSVALQFTHHLTYRSGLTDAVVQMMRSCFQRGIGPQPFAEMIRTNHTRRYEQLHLLYLEMVYRKLHSPLSHMLSGFIPWPAFSDRSGYAGFTPSANYFRDFYINMTRARASEMDQVTAMLSSKILAIDHSFKVVKHLAKVNGIPVFNAMYGGVNEWGEVRVLLLTASKAHSHYMPALQAVSRSLELYGHDPLELVFTDNPRADKPELERAFPSLQKDVVPVPEESSLERLTIPSNFLPIDALLTPFRVGSRCAEIIDCIPPSGDLCLAMDMEWPVDPETHLQGPVAVISIAYKQGVYVIPLNSAGFRRNGHVHLPAQLLSVLRSPRIKKVGVQVSADMARLFRDCGFSAACGDAPFVGAVNLGPLAKSRNAVSRGNLGLADLTATILKRFLPKDPTIRISRSWENATLSADQIEYAALDAFASWSVFTALQATETGHPVDVQTRSGTLVSLMSADHARVVAHGHIALDRPDKFNGVNVTKTRVVVTVTSVIVPGHMVSAELQPTKVAKPLCDFPSPPFNLLCRSSHLRTRAASALPSAPSERAGPSSDLISSSSCSSLLSVPQTIILDQTLDSGGVTQNDVRSSCDNDKFVTSNNQATCPSNQLPPEPQSQQSQMNGTSDEILAALQRASASESEPPIPLSSRDMSSTPWYDGLDLADPKEQDPASSVPDMQSQATAQALRTHHTSATLAEVTRSRVLGDIWHLMNQFPVSMRHGLRRPFARALRDAMFIPDPEDKAAMEAVLNPRGVVWENMVRYHSSWVWRRVRRYVPAAETLLPRILVVLSTFGPLKDAKTGEPLFNNEAWKIAENVLENVRRGLYSDPPGAQLYYIRGEDRFGLMRYRCVRGTNNIEGGLHQNIIRCFDVFNASPELAVELLRDYILHHNLRVCLPTLNPTLSTLISSTGWDSQSNRQEI
ncbi:hypothetical protein BXZ70DRAFT_1069038 [Cristinia sonorae]|uniref:3'-5' exonuclease n=1 Tax=Cristinia sonorae TaxID=1940300 RepID=A0A8K0UCG2_9AGAR|nr:hypothetical protein BXZ70DRAFT_1069038 [Cristinia sonorae]